MSSSGGAPHASLSDVPPAGSSQQASLLFTMLPVETLLIILAELDLQEIHWFQLTCRTAEHVVRNGREILYEAVAGRQFNCMQERSAGDSGIGGSRRVLDIAPSLDEAIRCSRLRADFHCPTVSSWSQFLMKMLKRERTWRHSVPLRCSDASLSRCDDARLTGLSIWRFKVSSEANLAIASTCRTNPEVEDIHFIVALPLRSVTARTPTKPYPLCQIARPYTHIEYSEGILVYCDDDAIHVKRLSEEGEDGHRSLIDIFRLVPPHRISSYKARYPYLLCEAYDAGRLLLYDLRNGQLAHLYLTEKTRHFGRSYVELDSDYLFQANESIFVTGVRNALQYNLLDPTLYMEHGDIEWDRDPLENFGLQGAFNALHHSRDSGHVLAASDEGELVWIRNFRDTPSKAARRASFAYLRPIDDSVRSSCELLNLCVEAGRVAFTMHLDDSMSVLYVFELIDWTDAQQLKQRAPTIRMVTGCILTNWHKVTRLEMDANAIYLTGVSSTLDEVADFELDKAPGYEVKLGWYGFGGEFLRDAPAVHVRGPQHVSSAEHHDLRHIVTTYQLMSNDAVIVYDFSTEAWTSAG